MHINAFYRRSTASGGVAQLFAAVSSPSPQKHAAAPPPGSSVSFLAKFDSTVPVAHKNALAKIIAILTAQNPGALISGVAEIQGHLAHVVQGTEGADTIAYAGGNFGSRQLSSYIDTGGGDDVISFASSGTGYHEISGGDGNDAIAASAQFLMTVDGGNGNDAIAVAGESIFFVQGGAGNDAIAVAGSSVANVGGGEGDDVIAVTGDYVVSVEGGDGNDTISVSSDNPRYFGSDPANPVHVHGVRRPVMIDGGKGNDTVNIDGEGYVIFEVGGGQDVVTISDRTEFDLRGKTWDDFSFNLKSASFANENGALVVTFAGRDEKLTIQSPLGDVKVEVTGSQSFVVTPA